MHAGELGHQLAPGRIHVHKGVGARNLGQLHHALHFHIARTGLHAQRTLARTPTVERGAGRGGKGSGSTVPSLSRTPPS